MDLGLTQAKPVLVTGSETPPARQLEPVRGPAASAR